MQNRVYVIGERACSERDTYRANTIENRGCLFICLYTSDVLEHKWRASLKTIIFLYE